LVKRAGQGVVFLITFGSSVLSFTTYGFSWKTVGAVALILIFLLSLLGNVLFFMASHLQSEKPRKIAFLTPSSGGQPFYTAMLTGLVRGASLALGQDYLVVPSMPTESFEAVSIWSLFAALEDRQVDIDGIIFIPDNPDRHFDELVGFHEKRGDIPLVLVDVYFDLANCDERTRARLPSFVGGDELAGGRIAAELAIGAVGSGRPSAPVVLVVNGGIAAWEQQRATAFRARIREEWPETQFVETPPFNYSRPAALSYCVGLFKSMADRQGHIEVHAIFACNDDMAIGVRGAIEQVQREGWIFTCLPQIVGYDGVLEICEYIQAGDPYMAGTVDVRVEDQARAAIMLIHKLIRTGERTGEIELIVPQPIVRPGIDLSR
jgi:ABC-type sugar transport system substrate-binding protein